MRLFIQISTALALMGLLLIYLRSDNKPASLNLPPFEEEVYLSVTAKWAPDDCVDVTVVTNLPPGTWYEVIAQRKRRPGALKRYEVPDQIYYPESRALFEKSSARMDHRQLFCGLTRARKHGGKQETYGLLIAVALAPTPYSLPNVPYEQAFEEQARRIGYYGMKLRGPLARPHVIEGRQRAAARSKTFILEPLPMLPEEDASEDEAGEEDASEDEAGEAGEADEK